MGNEFVYSMLAQQNITTLNEAGAKTIEASCPHCFNTIANEYPQLGGKVPGVQSQEMHRCVSHLIDPDLGRRRRLRSAGRAPRHKQARHRGDRGPGGQPAELPVPHDPIPAHPGCIS